MRAHYARRVPRVFSSDFDEDVSPTRPTVNSRTPCYDVSVRWILACCLCVGCGDDDVLVVDAGHDAGVDAQPIDATSDDGRPDATDASVPEVDPSCTAPGCLRDVEVIGDFSRAELLPFLEEGVEIDNGYSIVVIEYATRGGSSLATVALPFPRDPPPAGYAIVANAHGTVGLDDRCTLSGTIYGSGLAGLFGARGAIGVMPDYPGIGTDGSHPYLVADIEGASVLDALRAAANLARIDGTSLSETYATAGLSQGGHASLAAAAMHAAYAPELDVRAFAAAAPANVYLEQWQAGVGVDGSHIPLHAMLVYAFADHYAHDGPALFTAEVADGIEGVMATHCTFDFGGGVPTLEAELGTVAADVFDPAFLDAYGAGMLEAYPAIAEGFAANRVVPFEQSAAIAIWQGDSDPLVLQSHTDALVADLRAGGMDIDYRIVEGGTHIDVAFGFVASNELRTVESTRWVLERVYESR